MSKELEKPGFGKQAQPMRAHIGGTFEDLDDAALRVDPQVPDTSSAGEPRQFPLAPGRIQVTGRQDGQEHGRSAQLAIEVASEVVGWTDPAIAPDLHASTDLLFDLDLEPLMKVADPS